jgi:hypothetical protein
VQPTLAGQYRKQAGKLPSCGAQKPAIRRLIHDHLGHAQGQHLGIGEPSARVGHGLGKKIVRSTEHTDQQQLEVGVHRTALSVGEWGFSADFELLCYVPAIRPTAPGAVESII